MSELPQRDSIMHRLARDQAEDPALPSALATSAFNLLNAARTAIVYGRQDALERIECALDLITWGFEHLSDETADPGFREGAEGYRSLAEFIGKRDLAAIDRQLMLFAVVSGEAS